MLDNGRTNVIAGVFDCLEALLWSVGVVFSYFFYVGRCLFDVRTVAYVRTLAPRGLLSLGMRVVIDLRLGQYDHGIATIETLIGCVEESLAEETSISEHEGQVLVELYSLLAKIHLSRGHLDDAALAVIRASRGIGIDRLNDLPEFDASTAQIVKAAVAAGKMLENGETARVVVDPIISSSGRKPKPADGGLNPGGHIATVIPFPGRPDPLF